MNIISPFHISMGDASDIMTLLIESIIGETTSVFPTHPPLSLPQGKRDIHLKG